MAKPPNLSPASFRGAQFAVTNSETSGGRRIVVHQYPGRNTPWAEDMGRGVRRFRLTGFILNGDMLLGGATIAMQRSALITACEAKGAGTLVHPTLGSLNVMVEKYSIGEDLGAGYASDVTLDCVESGVQTFPNIAAVQGGIAAANTALKKASSASAVRRMLAAIAKAQAKLADVLTEVAKYASYAFILSTDATALYRLASVLSGSYGRYNAGGNAGLLGTNATIYSASNTVADLVPVASTARVAVSTAASTLEADALALTTGTLSQIPADIITLINALAAACADPSDAIRLMLEIIAYAAPGYATPMARPIADMVVSAAAAALTTAVAAYQPQSANDAAARINQIAPILDDLATQAADAGDDDSYQALCLCRVAIVNNLRASGATLPQVKTFTFGKNIPALALAQMIYGDPTRADQLVTQVNPPNPLFMPTSFQALAA